VAIKQLHRDLCSVSLEALAWWEWPHERLARMLPLFQGDTGAFLEVAEGESRPAP